MIHGVALYYLCAPSSGNPAGSRCMVNATSLQLFAHTTTATAGLILAVVFTYLSVVQEERYLLRWAFAAASYSAAALLNVVALASHQHHLFAVSAALFVLSAILFGKGTAPLLDRPLPRSALWAASIVVAASVVALYSGASDRLAHAPSAIFFSAAIISTGVVVLVKERLHGSAHLMFGAACVLLGVAEIVHVAVLHDPIPSAITQLFTSLMLYAVAIATFMMAIRKNQHDVLAAQGDLVRQAALLNQVSDAILELDAQARVVSVNEGAVQMLGVSRKELIGARLQDAFPGEPVDSGAQEVIARSRPERDSSWTMRYAHPDGHDLYLEVTSRAFLDGDGQVLGYAGVTRDVTDRWIAAKAVEHDEARYRTLFEFSPVGLWEEDFSGVLSACREIQDTGIENLKSYLIENPSEVGRLLSRVRILDLNEKTVELFGASSKEELIGKIDDVNADGSLSVFARLFAALADGAQEFESELPGQTLSGEPRELFVKFSVSPGHEGDLGRILVSTIDITERKRAEEELLQYRDSLEELVGRRTAQLQSTHDDLVDALRARDRFMANISHEMRTPLNSIIGFTGVVLQGLTGEIGEETRTQLEMVDRSGRQLLAMVEDLLEFTSVSGKGVHVEKDYVNLQPLLKTTCEMVRGLAEDKGLAVRCMNENAPVVRTDPVRVQQIMLNLLGNAIKYTETGSISLGCESHDGVVRISVADTGPGIPPESRELVFEPFQQLTPVHAAKHAGAGLGLAISRELTNAIGGELTVSPRTGGGSIFTLSLPAESKPHAR